MQLGLPDLADLAPILWTKWGNLFLEALAQEARSAADGLAFRAVNSHAGVRQILIVCSTDPGRNETVRQALSLKPATRSVDWATYSVAEAVLKTDKRAGFSHQERSSASGGTTLILCATRPAEVRRIEELCDLPE